MVNLTAMKKIMSKTDKLEYHRVRVKELIDRYSDDTFEMPLYVIDDINYHQNIIKSLEGF